MKKYNFLKLGLVLFLAIGMVISGCKKEEETPEPDPQKGSTSVQEVSTDDNYQQKVTDEIFQDVESVMSAGNQRSIDWLPCNATIDSANVVNDTVTYYITYHGLNCEETLYRTGQVRVHRHVNENWMMQGATVIIEIINFNVIHVQTQYSITINGTQTHTNVTGGLLVQLGFVLTEVIHKTTGFMTIQFDDNTNRTWNIARRMLYTGTLGDFTVAMDGFGLVGSYSNVVTWGVSRSGDQFYISTPQSVVITQACNWNPVSGIETIDIPSSTTGATLTFGYDENNQPIEPGNCPSKYKMDWYYNGYSGTIFLWL